MRFIRLVRRDATEYYLSVALLSFAGSVSLTRFFLSLAGYPQIGTGELHIAHVLWGGLLLFAAALLPLIIANRWVYTAAALLAGVGVGLFIDEVGKFITQSNNYFYPAAAPIVYTFFLLTILILLNVHRLGASTPHADLHGALEQIRELLVYPLKPKEHALLESRLNHIAEDSTSERHADLARALLKFIKYDAPATSSTQPDSQQRTGLSVITALRSLVSAERLRILLIIGISAIGLLTLKDPFQVSLAGWLPPEVSNLLQNLYAGRRIDPLIAPSWFETRLVLEVVVGILLLVSASLLIVGRKKQGAALGFMALLLSLTTVNLLLFYFEQFSTIITTSIQFLLLLGLVYYQRKLSAH
jgi:hypothetical protein